MIMEADKFPDLQGESQVEDSGETMYSSRRKASRLKTQEKLMFQYESQDKKNTTSPS